MAGLALLIFAAPLAAQGVTTAAIQGTVAAMEGSAIPLGEATVLVTNTSTGHRWQVMTGERSRYFVENLPVGGPYSIEVTAAGFEPATRSGFVLALGQRSRVDFVLEPTVVQMEEVTLTTAHDPRLNAGRTGPAQTIDRSTLQRLPVLNRDVLGLTLESPLVNRSPFGLSIAGQFPQYNRFQIDGGENGSLYGRFAPTPGGLINLVAVPGGGGLRTVPLDAVKEMQVVVSPFDVREGGFTGGLINVVTESGTNVFRGSAFATLQNDELVGEDVDGNPIADFSTWQFGGTVGGPVLRDRLHFFLATDLQEGTIPYQAPLIGADTTGGADSAGVGIRNSTATRVQSILRDTYGVDPGSFGAVPGRNPAQSVFAKLTAQLATNSVLEVSQSYVHGADQGLFLDREQNGPYDFTSADIHFGSTTSATRLNWNAVFGDRVANELILAYFTIHDFCEPREDAFAFVSVTADRGFLNAGDKFSCAEEHGSLRQRIAEGTDNVTFGLGAHRITVGTHDQLLHFEDANFFASSGNWSFDSPDSLEQGLSSFYSRQLPGPSHPDGPLADFDVVQLGVYVQDQWSPVRGLLLTAGLRLDVPFFPDQPPTNPELESELGIDSGRIPSGNPLWSPRVGFNYDVGGRGHTSVRGGAGLFSGHPAYYLIGDAYRSTGLERLSLVCEGEDVPAFTVDLDSQPVACREGGPAPLPIVNVIDPDFRFPQSLKIALGVDRRLGRGLVATVDVLYTRSTEQVFFRDANLLPAVGAVSGEANRPLYGSIDPATGEAVTSRRSAEFGPVFEQTNQGRDRGLSVTGQFQGRLADRVDVNASYTYSRAEDVLSLAGLGISLDDFGIVGDQVAFTALDGPREAPNVRTSRYDVPHRVRVSGTVALPYGVGMSLIYQGSSGSPFAYTVDGDANADGFGPDGFSNDIVYVPRNSSPGGDVTLAVFDPEQDAFVPAPASEYGQLERFVQSEACLREQRGRIMRRNSCRNPWRSSLDMRLSRSFSTWGGQSVELTADLFNVSNLLNSDWGLQRNSSGFGEEVNMLQLVGYDTTHDRGIYALELPLLNETDTEGSRWRLQLGMRYRY